MSNIRSIIGHSPDSSVRPYLFKKDAVGRIHLRQSDHTAVGATKFRLIRDNLLRGKLVAPTPLTKLAISLICLDGIATRQDLTLALKNFSQAYKVDEEVCIDWQYENRQVNRRYLSPISINLLAGAKHASEQHTNVLEHLNELLCGYYPIAASPLDSFLADTQSWLTQILPGPLWAHCLSAILLSALPRNVFARQSAELALSSNQPPDKSETDIALGHAMDGYLAWNGLKSGSQFISQLKTICQNDVTKAHYLEKKRMLKECMALTPETKNAGPISSLILAWVIDFIESGTPWHENYSPHSIQKYVGNAVDKLFFSFQGIRIEELTSEQFTDMYSVIVDSAKPSQQQTTAAALNAWHSFIHTWLDVPPLNKSLHQDVDVAIPRANVLWPHEISSVLLWLVSASMDERLTQQLILAVHIAVNLRIRISELLKLRMHNFQPTSTGIQVQINPMRRDGKTKSPSARRHMFISDSKATSAISNWLARRKMESALSSDLIFADPHTPSQGYRLGQLYVCLNRLLKSVTGDKSASSHIFSHTWVSNSFSDSMINGTSTDLNPLDLSSTAAGHASTQTTLIHYFHLFEKPLRHYLDRALLNEVKFTGSIVEMFSSTSSATFRQRRHRKKDGVTDQEIAWHALATSRHDIDWPTAHLPFSMDRPHVPAFLFNQPQLEFADVLNVLVDLTAGIAPINTSSRNGKPVELVYEIAAYGCQIIEEINLAERSVAPKRNIDAVLTMQKIFPSKSRNINFTRIHQPKLLPLLYHLERHLQPQALAAATTSWLHCFTKGYISLTNPANGANLVKFLRDAGVANDRIFLCTPGRTEDEMLTRSINSIFIGAGLPPPPLLKLEPRRGRPTHYLMVSSAPGRIGQKVSNAALSIDGLNALMFTASIFSRIPPHHQNNKITIKD